MIGFIQALFGIGGKGIGPREAVKRLDTGALLVDVREPHEFYVSHAPQAHSLPLSRLRDEGIAAIHALFPAGETREILLICQSGTRSRMARHALSRHPQFKSVNVDGGMTAWMRSGLPVTRTGNTQRH